MKEIGSEFWTGCTPTSGVEYTMRPAYLYYSHPYKVIETLSGRTALEHIVEILIGQGKKRAYLPSYCCHTMIEPFLKHGMMVDFYDVDYSNNSLHRRLDSDAQYDAILLMDYFGHTDVETHDIALNEKQRGNTVIYDATHSLYSSIKTDAYDFIYGSYRKWVDINCGFCAWKDEFEYGEIVQNGDNYEYAEIRRQLFDKKADYMNGNLIEKEDFLPLINNAESILEKMYHHAKPDKRSKEVLRTTDVSYVKDLRIANARILTEAINEFNDERIRCINPLLNEYDVPLFVPVFISSGLRDKLRHHLIENDIYCPIHWPKSDVHGDNPGSRVLFESELSLVCDQRYNANDMNRIVEMISCFIKQ